MKNKILKATAYIMGAAFFVSGISLDTNSIIPYIICGASLAWLVLFAYANGFFYGQEETK